MQGKRLELRGPYGQLREPCVVDAPALPFVWNHPELRYEGSASGDISANVAGAMARVRRDPAHVGSCGRLPHGAWQMHAHHVQYLSILSSTQ
jgi:hypothetical protein